MDFRTAPLHPEFPHLVWVVVEQPAGEPCRLKYDPEQGVFLPTTRRSLFHARGFSGTYGWVGGLGMPPAPHQDVLLVTRRQTCPGEVLLGRTCGLFLRADGDHKLVALDEALVLAGTEPDLAALAPGDYQELIRLYQRLDPGEGWYGAAAARAFLERLHP